MYLPKFFMHLCGKSNCLDRGLGCCCTNGMSYFSTWFSVLLISPFDASYLEIKVKLLNFDIVLKKKMKLGEF